MSPGALFVFEISTFIVRKRDLVWSCPVKTSWRPHGLPSGREKQKQWGRLWVLHLSFSSPGTLASAPSFLWSPPVGVKVQHKAEMVVPRCSHTLYTQEDCGTAPILVHGHLSLLEKAGPGLLSSSSLEPNSQFPISCSLPPGLHLPPSDLRSVVLRPLASGEVSRDPLALTLGNRHVSKGYGWAHEPRVKAWAVHSETTSLHKTELLPLGPLLGNKNQKMGSPLFLYLFPSISLKLGLMVLVY